MSGLEVRLERRPVGIDFIEQDTPRLAFRFDKFHYGRLRQLIDAVNQLVDA